MSKGSKHNAGIKAKTESKYKAKANYRPSKAQPFRVDTKSMKMTNVNRVLTEDQKKGHMRTNATQKRLNMYKTKITRKQHIARFDEPNQPVRIAPSRNWFTNTRTISTQRLDELRTALEGAREDPYSVVIKKSKIPMSLIDHRGERETPTSKLLTFTPYADIMGPKATRKKPQVKASSFEEMRSQADEREYDTDQDKQLRMHTDCVETITAMEPIMKKGTSRRIWKELYKVVDSSDIVCYIVDARDPNGTRCRALEKHIKKDRAHKHQILVLNKVDLVPNSVTEKWIRLLSKEIPTIGFCSNLKKGFGRHTFINLLRQYSKMLKDRRHVSVGFVGYPNVGKSSVINALRDKIVCKVAPIPGETKVWQYISLTNRVHLIDCPGVVPSDPNDDVSLVLKGVVRAEKLEEPEAYIPYVMQRVKDDTLRKRYRIPSGETWTDSTKFLEVLGIKMGKLKRGGEVDMKVVARLVLYDWQRGRLAYFVLPPTAGVEKPLDRELEKPELEGL